jgi:HlyD family secretion protein
MLKRTKKIIIGAAVVSAIAAAVAIARRPAVVAVDTAVVTRGKVVVTVDEDGRTRVKDRYVVSAPRTGKISRIALRPGDLIEAGQTIAHLIAVDPPLLDARAQAELDARVKVARAMREQAKAAIERARAAHELAAVELERTRRLLEAKSTPPQALERAVFEERSAAKTLDSAIFGDQVAEHELAAAQAALFGARDRRLPAEAIEVSSPVSGVVLRVLQENEGVLAAGAPLIELGDPRALEIVADVLTRDAVRIARGAQATIDRWGGEASLRAHVLLVEPSAFTKLSALGIEEQRVNVVLEIDEPREVWATLGDGYRVEVSIITDEAVDAVRVAASAVFRDGDRSFVFAVREGRAERQAIDPGRTNAIETEVLGGVEPGAEVIAYPSDRVEEGARVVAR